MFPFSKIGERPWLKMGIKLMILAILFYVIWKAFQFYLEWHFEQPIH